PSACQLGVWCYVVALPGPIMPDVNLQPVDQHDDEGASGERPSSEPEGSSEVRASDLEAVEEIADAHRQIVEQIKKRIIGQTDVVEHLLCALFARGHCLFVGVPGLAKTLLISTLAETL